MELGLGYSVSGGLLTAVLKNWCRLKWVRYEKGVCLNLEIAKNPVKLGI